jgi:nitrite reductase/ring-hydroxylating ferredoxin subunit
MLIAATRAMAEREAAPTSDGEPPQPLVGFRTNAEWDSLVAEASAMIEELERIGDADLRGQLFGALDAIDAIHREALHRLVRLFKKGVLAQVVTDPAIRTLMGMYDLLPPEKPGCAKVWDFMPKEGDKEPLGSGRPGMTEPPVAAERPQEPPHWTPAPLAHPLTSGQAEVCRFDEGPVLIAEVRGETFAAVAQCPHHDAAMLDGSLSNYSWACPHGDGCIYDIRNGARLGGGPQLTCLPVRRDDRNRLLIGFGIPFEPHLPAF